MDKSPRPATESVPRITIDSKERTEIDAALDTKIGPASKPSESETPTPPPDTPSSVESSPPILRPDLPQINVNTPTP